MRNRRMLSLLRQVREVKVDPRSLLAGSFDRLGGSEAPLVLDSFVLAIDVEELGVKDLEDRGKLLTQFNQAFFRSPLFTIERGLLNLACKVGVQKAPVTSAQDILNCSFDKVDEDGVCMFRLMQRRDDDDIGHETLFQWDPEVGRTWLSSHIDAENKKVYLAFGSGLRLPPKEKPSTVFKALTYFHHYYSIALLASAVGKLQNDLK